MKTVMSLPALAFVLVLGAHVARHAAALGSGEWATFTPEGSRPPPATGYFAGGKVWLGLSYATAGAFAVFCLTRLYKNRKRAVAGAAGGLALTGFLYAAGCFLLGCCGSPMLAVYLSLFGPQFLGLTGPLVFGLTLASVAVGLVCIPRKTNRGACFCEPDASPADATQACGRKRTSAQGCVSEPERASRPEAMGLLMDSVKQAAASEKCRACGCAHELADAVDRALPSESRSTGLSEVLAELRGRLRPVQYDCRGCQRCFGAEGMNALSDLAGEASAANAPEPRSGWPPLPGDHHVIRYHAPVAVCTLTDSALSQALADVRPAEVALVGTLQTENLGIERVIANIVANPNIRFLILCGADSRQKVGHLPGQSLVSLCRNGTDENGRIIGAQGRRPHIRNVSREAVEHFRRFVEVVDLIGSVEAEEIGQEARARAERDPGPAEPFRTALTQIERVAGTAPERMTPDPQGYFVVFLDRRRSRLCLEHYQNDGLLDSVIEGERAPQLYHTAIERSLVLRLDHAAYLGRELARAEYALRSGEEYVQDAAPEREWFSPECGLDSAGGGPP